MSKGIVSVARNRASNNTSQNNIKIYSPNPGTQNNSFIQYKGGHIGTNQNEMGFIGMRNVGSYGDTDRYFLNNAIVETGNNVNSFEESKQTRKFI
jgi:hypothetical protein